MAIVDAALVDAVFGVITAEFGPIAAGLDATEVNAYRMKLARCIAKAAQYVRDNGIVNPGISVLIPATAGPGSPSSGATNAPGSIS